MPLYEYQCEACGHRFEIIQKFSDPPVEKCPVCGGQVQKLMSAPAFQFKGTGWYVTDYARKNGSSSGGTTAGETKTEGKTDKAESKGTTEPAKKTETSSGDASSSKPSPTKS